MISAKTFDELNGLIENKRSMPYKDYFGEMQISDAEKKKRISLAEKMEEMILPVVILMFTMQQYQNKAINWEYIRGKLEQAYRDALDGVLEIDNYMDIHIKEFSYNIVESTQNHMNEPYYFSHDRAVFISEDETNTVMNYHGYTEAKTEGKTQKRWRAILDKETRDTHWLEAGNVIGIDDLFRVGNSLMLFPKDTSFGAEAKEVVNCRCIAEYF